MTRDHRVVADVEDPERVRLAAAKACVRNNRIYPGGLAVSRSIGDTGFSNAWVPTPDCHVLELAAGQRFVLATDGLWDSLAWIVKRNRNVKSVEALVEQLASRRATPDPHTAATILMKRCLHDVGCLDDVTVIVLDVTTTTSVS